SRRRHTRFSRDWSSDVCSSDLTELAYLVDVLTAAIEAGATTLNIPDTVGYTVPAEFDRLFRALREQVPGIDGVTLSVHCHDDLRSEERRVGKECRARVWPGAWN